VVAWAEPQAKPGSIGLAVPPPLDSLCSFQATCVDPGHRAKALSPGYGSAGSQAWTQANSKVK